MTFLACIQKNVDKGLLSKNAYTRLEKEYNQLVEQYRNTMGDEQAAIQAASKLIAAKKKLAEDKARTLLLATRTQERIVSEFEEIRKADPKATYGKLYSTLMDRAHNRRDGVLRQAYSNLGEFVDKYSSKYAGLHTNRDNIQDVVRVMVDKNHTVTGKDSIAFGRSLRETKNMLRQRFINAGGVVGDLENHFPQVHMKERVKQVSFEDWYNELRPKLDITRMIDDETGLPFDDIKLKEVMRENYQNIVTDGRHAKQKQLDAGKSTRARSWDMYEVSTRKQSKRFYHFKSADDFLAYNRDFGMGDEGLYEMMVGEIEMMSRDIGIMEVMGPKPTSLTTNMIARMDAAGESVKSMNFIQGQFDVLSGATDGTADEGVISNFVYNTQNVLRSAMLGSASLSAVSDTAFLGITARLYGMPATKAITKYGKMLNPASSADRKMAYDSGYIYEIATQGAMQDTRIAGGDMAGNRFTASLAAFTNRASGLAAMTRATKNAVALETQAHLSRLRDMSWDSLLKDKQNAKFRQGLEQFGINKEDWELLQKVEPIETPQGVAFLRQNEIAITGENRIHALDVSNKIDDFIVHLQKTAVNEPDLRVRAVTTGAAFARDARKGTIPRTLASSILMFKSFTGSVMLRHVLPAFKSAKQGHLEHLAGITLGATIMGAGAMQLKEISKGKEPRDMNNPKFWLAAATQGGGFGLFGDFLFADYSRFGRDPIYDIVGGPVAGTLNDVARTFMGNFNRAMDEDMESNFGVDLFNLAKRNAPGVNLWYSRLMLDRLLLDQAEKMIDPDFDSKRRRMEKRQFNDYGNEYWWRKGEVTPE